MVRWFRRSMLATVAVLTACMAVPAGAEPVKVYAAGRLKVVMTEIGTAFEAAHGTSMAGTFGASGLLGDILSVLGGQSAPSAPASY